ncbi:MAG TPA: FxsA family protein [bacterium]|nr:FxsA family protein [bacterium]
MLKWIFFTLASAFVALEVTVLLWVGGHIGIGWTLVWIIGSSLLGIAMVRVAGLHAVMRIHRRLREQELPTQELLDMALILVGGFFLIAPGFVSDGIGLLLLLSPVRWVVRGLFSVIYGQLLPSHYPPGHFNATRGPAAGEDVIEIRAQD